MNLSKQQVNDLASPLVGIISKFYEDPQNEKEFQKWLKQQQEKSVEESS